MRHYIASGGGIAQVESLASAFLNFFAALLSLGEGGCAVIRAFAGLSVHCGWFSIGLGVTSMVRVSLLIARTSPAIRLAMH
jgi:hypothetical protein